MSLFARHTKGLLGIIWVSIVSMALLVAVMDQQILQFLELYFPSFHSRATIGFIFLAFIPGAVLSGLLMMTRGYFENYARMFRIDLPEYLTEKEKEKRSISEHSH
jgi:hypothetical protein